MVTLVTGGGLVRLNRRVAGCLVWPALLTYPPPVHQVTMRPAAAQRTPRPASNTGTLRRKVPMSSDQSTTPPERCINYVRVSDDKQSGASSQLTNARALARTHGLDVVAEVEDDGLSGDDLDRAGLNKVLQIAGQAQRRG